MMQQQNPWEMDWGGGASPPAPPSQAPGIIYGRPKQADPLEQRRLDLSEQANERANRADLRSAEASDRAARAAERTAGVDSQKLISGLRDDYNRDPAVKKYGEAVTAYASALESAPTPQGDLSLIYAFAKVMDPESVVREGEAASVAASDTLYGRTVARLQKELGEGGTFSAEARKNLRNELRNRMGQLNDAYLGTRVRYKELARTGGYDPGAVVGEHAGKRFQDTESRFLGRPIGEVDYFGNPPANPAATPARPAGEVVFNDQMPDTPRGYRFDSGQQLEIVNAIRRGDEEAALSLMEKYSGFPRTPETVESVRGAIKNPGAPIAFDYAAVDKPYLEEVKDFRKLSDKAGAADAGDYTRLSMQGGSMQLSDEIAGLSGGLGFALRGRNPLKGYTLARDAERMRLEESRNRTGTLGLATEIGSGAAVPIGAGGAKSASLLQRVKAGSRAGGLAGIVSGFGSGEGLEESGRNAAIGGVAGTVLGGTVPVLGQIAGNRIGGLRRLAGRDPALPRRLISEAISADKNTPRSVGTMMTEAADRGSPLALADTGENVRGLLGAVARQPGPGRTLAREAIIGRQMEQMDRIAGAIRRDLGETANVREVSDRLIQEAQEAARPLYDEFKAAPGASSVMLDDLVSRPSMRQALARAQRIAAEEGRDPNTLGFALGPDGDVQLTRVPSFETLDYMKQGMDDFIESFRDPLTGKLKLNKEGRAANDTLRVFLNRIDKVNPTYKEARQAYAGPARMADALERGEKALNKTADDLSAEVARMNEAEMQMYRLGLRQAMVNMLESRTDRGDKVQALLGTPKKRAALMRAFGGKSEFDRFMATLNDEAAMNETFRSMATGSQTAERLAGDAQVNDPGLVESAMEAGIRGGREGLTGAVLSVVQKLRDVSKFGPGESGQRARESIAALLTETDPTLLEELIRSAEREVARQEARAVGAGTRAGVIGSGTGRLATIPMARSNEPVK